MPTQLTEQQQPMSLMTTALPPVEQHQIKSAPQAHAWRRPVTVRESSPERKIRQITNALACLFSICGLMWAHGTCHSLDIPESQQDLYSVFAMTAVPFLSYPSAKPLARLYGAINSRRRKGQAPQP